jgi:Zn-dependent protease with chaperone function
VKVSYKDFIHPQDDAARRELEAVPGFDMVTKCFLKFGVEKFLHGYLMANYIRLSESQLPDVYNLLPSVAEKFGIEEPEFYLQMNPTPNACTMGDNQCFIVVTSGLLEHITDRQELEAVIAHECGHISCRHVFYKTMAGMLSMLGAAIGIPPALSAPIGIAFNYWSRRSELSADRAAAVYLGSPDPMVGALLRLAGGPSQFTAHINVEEYADQAEAYYTLQKESKWHRILQNYAVMNSSHPFSAVRIRELQKWCEMDKYTILCKCWQEGLRMFRCRKCGNDVSCGDRFCCHCGSLIE